MTAMRAGCGEIDCTAPVYDDMFILDLSMQRKI